MYWIDLAQNRVSDGLLWT